MCCGRCLLAGGRLQTAADGDVSRRRYDGADRGGVAPVQHRRRACFDGRAGAGCVVDLRQDEEVRAG